MQKTLLQTCAIAFATAFFAATSLAQSTKTSRIGFLGPTSQLDELRNALAKLNYAEGKNIVIDARWPADDRLDQLSAIAEGFVSRKVDVIVAIGASAARAARTTTAQVPIVFAGVVNPVTTGLVTSLANPDGNVTGVTTFDPEHARSQIEILKDALPGLERVAILGDSGSAPAMYQTNDDAARAAGLATVVLKAERGAPDFDSAFATAKKDGAQAVLVLSTPVTTPHRRHIAEASIRYKIPIMSPRDHADAGGLLSFGTSFSAATRRAATHGAKILDGSKPSELPIEMVRQHELVINKKTSNELGLALPEHLVNRAHQVIQ